MKEYLIKNIEEFKNIDFNFKKWDIIFLKWDLWAWKTALVKYILKNYFNINEIVRSPTYTYYQKYNNSQADIYHMDLYRLWDYNEFINIWWEEVLDNKDNIAFIEWPDILEDYYKADYIINIEIISNNTIEDEVRKISIKDNKLKYV